MKVCNTVYDTFASVPMAGVFTLPGDRQGAYLRIEPYEGFNAVNIVSGVLALPRPFRRRRAQAQCPDDARLRFRVVFRPNIVYY